MSKNYNLSKDFFHNPLRFDGISVFQIGRIYCQNELNVEADCQNNFLRLTVITDGIGTVIINKTPIRVKHGDMFLSLNKDCYTIKADNKTLLELDYVCFQCNNENFKLELEQIIKSCNSSPLHVFSDSRIRPLINSAINEINNNTIYSNELLSSIFKQIIIFSIRSYQKNQDESVVYIETSPQILCNNIMNYIDNHIFSILSLRELSDVMGYSYGYMSTLFKKTTGGTISDYYLDKRLEKARQLLMENNLPISEIAEMLNYTSSYSFSKAFTNHFGISPRNYRNR